MFSQIHYDNILEPYAVTIETSHGDTCFVASTIQITPHFTLLHCYSIKDVSVFNC